MRTSWKLCLLICIFVALTSLILHYAKTPGQHFLSQRLTNFTFPFVSFQRGGQESKTPIIKLNGNTGKMPDNGFYFLETSGNPFLSPKQLCSIESAAKHHPKRTIMVGMTSERVFEYPGLMNLLRHYPNVLLLNADLPSWLNGTVLGPWLKKNLLMDSRFRVVQTSDILRLATLYKFGGIYLDLDFIVLRSMDGLKNSIGLQSHTLDGANNGALIFEKGHKYLETCLDGIAEGFDGNSWGGNGPWLLSRKMNEWCGKPSNHSMEPMTCKGVTLLETKAFYPLPYPASGSLFAQNEKTAAEVLATTNESFAIHLWNKMSFQSPILINSTSAVAQLARENCPLTSSDFDGELWSVYTY